MSDTPLPEISLSARLEALLFVASGAVTPAQLASALEVSTNEVNQGLADLEAMYVAEGPRRGLRI